MDWYCTFFAFRAPLLVHNLLRSFLAKLLTICILLRLVFLHILQVSSALSEVAPVLSEEDVGCEGDSGSPRSDAEFSNPSAVFSEWPFLRGSSGTLAVGEAGRGGVKLRSMYIGKPMLQYPFSKHLSYESAKGAIPSTYSLSKLQAMRMQKIFVYESSSKRSSGTRLNNKI